MATASPGSAPSTPCLPLAHHQLGRPGGLMQTGTPRRMDGLQTPHRLSPLAASLASVDQVMHGKEDWSEQRQVMPTEMMPTDRISSTTCVTHCECSPPPCGSLLDGTSRSAHARGMPAQNITESLGTPLVLGDAARRLLLHRPAIHQAQSQTRIH